MIKHDSVLFTHFERYTPLATTFFFVLLWAYWVYCVGLEVWHSLPVYVLGWTLAHYSFLSVLALVQCRQRRWDLNRWLYACRWEIIFFYWVVPAIVVQAALVAWGFDWVFDYYYQKSGSNYKPSFPPFAITLPLWPLFLLLWYIRDINRATDIRQAHMNHLQADFHKLQEWATTSEKTALRVSAIHQLKRYLTGEVLDGKAGNFEKPVLSLFNVILAEMGEGEPESANQAIKTAIEAVTARAKLKLSDSEAHQLLGEILEKLGSQKAALKEQERALDLDPENVDALFGMGFLLQEIGDLQQAEVFYRLALEKNPDFHEAWNNLGMLLQSLGRHEEAGAAYRKALEMKPDDEEGWYNLGNLRQSQGRHEEAEAAYRKVLEMKPDKTEAWYNLANLLQSLERAEEAKAAYRKVLEIKPDDHASWTNLGNLLQSQGRHEEAEAAYRSALEIKPDKHEAWNNLGNLLQSQGCHEEAESGLRKSARDSLRFSRGLDQSGESTAISGAKRRSRSSLPQSPGD